MNPILAKFLTEAIQDNGGDARVYDNYSGGMFELERTTTGIIVNDWSDVVMALLRYMAVHKDTSTLPREITSPDTLKWDFMGKNQIIVY